MESGLVHRYRISQLAVPRILATLTFYIQIQRCQYKAIKSTSSQLIFMPQSFKKVYLTTRINIHLIPVPPKSATTYILLLQKS